MSRSTNACRHFVHRCEWNLTLFSKWKFPGESLALVSAQSFALNAPRNECRGCMQRRDLSGRRRADKLDPSSIIGEDLLHRRGGAQKAAILGACDRRSFPGRANRDRSPATNELSRHR